MRGKQYTLELSAGELVGEQADSTPIGLTASF